MSCRRETTGQGDRQPLTRGAALSAPARVRGAGERAAGDLRRGLRGLLGARGPRARHLVRAVYEAARVGAAVCEVVSRRQAQHRLQLRRPSRRARAGRQGRVLLGRRGRGRTSRDHLLGTAARGREMRERVEGPRGRQGNAGRDLHGDGARGADCDACLRPAWSAAYRRLRRFLGRIARRPAAGHGVPGADHPGRSLAPRHDGAAEADRRRGDGRLTDGKARTRAPTHRRRRADDRGPRRLVGRGRHRRIGLPSRADGRRGHALPPLHLRHHGEAERDHPHDRRLPRRRRDDAPLHLRPETGDRCLLVRRRRRLGDRPQLHRLRPALQRQPPR